MGKRSGRQSVRTVVVLSFCGNPDDPSRWLYSLFIAMDANFRLKLKSRGIQDPELGSGLAYFVNNAKFEAHLKNHVGEDNVGVSPFYCLLFGQELTR